MYELPHRVGLTHGVFDFLHAGHLEHLKQACAMCDQLIVSVLADRYVYKPFIVNDERTRMFQVSMVKGVSDVILCDAEGPLAIMRKLKPDVYIRKDEYIKMIPPEYAVAKELGIECKFTKTVPPSAKEIIQRIWSLKERL